MRPLVALVISVPRGEELVLSTQQGLQGRCSCRTPRVTACGMEVWQREL